VRGQKIIHADNLRCFCGIKDAVWSSDIHFQAALQRCAALNMARFFFCLSGTVPTNAAFQKEREREREREVSSAGAAKSLAGDEPLSALWYTAVSEQTKQTHTHTHARTHAYTHTHEVRFFIWLKQLEIYKIPLIKSKAQKPVIHLMTHTHGASKEHRMRS